MKTFTERPILFSTPMIRAILEGRKTMTRRVLKPQPEGGEGIAGVKFPYGRIGDVLWVRETWKQIDSRYIYKAGPFLTQEEIDSAFTANNPKWKPSIFMPKDACRIKLRITNICVERLNDISEEDAKAEGVTLRGNIIKENNSDFTHKYRFAFCLLWESINGKRSWDQNPWVWVIEFERVK